MILSFKKRLNNHCYKILDGDNEIYFYDENGHLHRENELPAVICTDGYLAWWEHGKRHRDNKLPAVIYLNIKKQWWHHGVFIREEQEM